MRILCCGDRWWTDKKLIHDVLAQLSDDTVIIHGDCRGADRIAAMVGQELGLEIVAYPAKWDRYGRGAGPIRNQQMLTDGRPDKVYAFHDNLEKSKGTRDMIERANTAHVEVIKYFHL